MAGAPQISTAFKWTPLRIKAAAAIAEHDTIVKAAEAAGVDRKSLYNWMEHPEFLARVEQLLTIERQRAEWRLRRKADAVAEKLVNIALYGTPRHSVQLAGCKDVLDRIGLKPAEKIEHEHSGAVDHRVIAVTVESKLADLAGRAGGGRLLTGDDGS
jgi:hypothetical protein